MTNQDLVKSRLADARQFLEYASRADTILDRAKAEESLEQSKFVVSTVEALIASREQ